MFSFPPRKPTSLKEASSQSEPSAKSTNESSSRPEPRSLIAWRSGETPAFRSRLRSLLQAVLVSSLAIIMLGAGDTSEKRYERIGHNMMCGCTCGQILLECNHVSCPESGPMTIELRQQLAQGGSDRVIFDWFVNKYGATILAAPLRGGFDNVAWITPIALFLAAILGTVLVIRVWKSRTQQREPLKIKGMTAASTDELRERIRRETLY